MAEEPAQARPPKPWWVWPALFTLAGALGLGNGAWSYVTEPALFWVRNTFLNLVTLGIQAERDGIYAHAARGYHDHSGTTLLLALMFAASALLGVYVAWSLSLLRAAKSMAHGTEERPSWITRRLLGDPDNDPKGAYPRIRAVHVLSMLLMAYAFGSLATRAVKGQFCSEAISYFAQVRAVAAPHVTNEALLQYDARFATVRSRDDYMSLMRDLDAEARRHTDKVPKFNVW